MIRNLATAGKRVFTSMSHERNINVLHLGNRVIFDVPLYFERGIIVKDTRVEGNRMIVNAIKRMDEEINEQKRYDLEGCCPKK